MRISCADFPLPSMGKVALPLIEDAYAAQSAEDLELRTDRRISVSVLLLVTRTFSVGSLTLTGITVTRTLWRLWTACGHLRRRRRFFARPQIITENLLEYDDNRALAVKAIWALGKIPGSEAEIKLQILARSDNEILRKAASGQLERRHTAT
jgi:hypothetical protein